MPESEVERVRERKAKCLPQMQAAVGGCDGNWWKKNALVNDGVHSMTETYSRTIS